MKLHVVLTKNDADIVALKKFLPEGQFSKNVVFIIKDALKDRVASMPMKFKIEPIFEDVHTKISIPDSLLEAFCEKFGYSKGNVTTGIKKEIKLCIRKNRKKERVKRVSSDALKDVFENAFQAVDKKRKELDDRNASDEEYAEVLKEYHKAFDKMIVELKDAGKYHWK